MLLTIFIVATWITLLTIAHALVLQEVCGASREVSVATAWVVIMVGFGFAITVTTFIGGWWAMVLAVVVQAALVVSSTALVQRFGGG